MDGFRIWEFSLAAFQVGFCLDIHNFFKIPKNDLDPCSDFIIEVSSPSTVPL